LDCDWLEAINFSMAYHCDYDNENKFTLNKEHNNKFTGNEGFERLQQLPRLRSLDFGITGLTNISFLRHLPRLKLLTLASNPITDIGPIASLKHLTYLNLNGAEFKDMRSLSHLTDLRYLYLSGNPHTAILPISNLSFLLALKKLKNLEISHSELTDISSLKELTELESLKLFANKKLSNINGIQNLYNLKKADLSSNNIKDLFPLYSRDVNLGRLEKLNLERNEIEHLDLCVLNNMLSLKELSMGNNRVRNVPTDILHYGTIGEIRRYLRSNG